MIDFKEHWFKWILFIFLAFAAGFAVGYSQGFGSAVRTGLDVLREQEITKICEAINTGLR